MAVLGRPISGQVVHLGDRVAVVERVIDAERARHADEAVGDEVGRVLATHDALAQDALAIGCHEIEHGGIGVLVGDDLEQGQVARRVEEVRAQEMALEILAASLGDGADGQAAGVGRDDRARFANGIQPGHQVALDRQILDDGLDDPVGIGQSIDVVFEIAGRDQPQVVGVVKLGGAALFESFQVLEHNRVAPLREIAGRAVRGGDVQQDHRHADPRQQRRDAAAHRAGPDDTCFANLKGHYSLSCDA